MKALRTALLFGMAASAVWAQNIPQANPTYPQNQNQNAPEAGIDADSAAHAVGRLSLMNGSVSVAHGDDGQMAGAILNAPLVTSDRLLTGPDGRAEIELDPSNAVRASGSTELRMGDLQYKRFQVQIAQGLITFRVL